MSEHIKKTAITAAGYIYQNRQGLKVLCDWLDAPVRYSRVKFECDNENEAPQGLDDIVIERSDGLVDLQQIKFTPDADKHPLSWDWMLEKTGKTERSRSMLRKWFDAFKQLDPARIGEISLITNRRPDVAIEACLGLDRIHFSKIPEPQRSRVETELGSIEECEAFFNQLRIQHSDKGYIALEHDVDARLRLHGTPEGIATLKNIALNWATQKNTPAPNGWITQTELRTILRASPPTPLPEDFVVPKGYEVPDETFHQEFVQSIINATGKAIVLTGPPGRGKSTYLSALCDTLAEQGIPTVRHHYFLSTTERGRDRLNSYVVEQSIQAQIQQFHGDVPKTSGGLHTQLEACATHYKALGKPFVLIIDGLDHVWRINAEDKRPLDDLFSQVIPCPDNMVLLVGTQPVNDAQLPTDLLAFAPKAEWRTLPAMSENAVLSYLRRALQEGKLTSHFEDERQVEEQLQDAASALRNRTNGHPLHVIYATAELEHAGHKLSRWDVEQLKGDLSKDAKFYYASLWEHLPPSQKDTLRLICAFPFFWPKTAFSEITAIIKLADPEVGKVEHLLHSSAAGLKVFHESLAVFVRATAGYEARINELMPAVTDWLERLAPSSLRVNWLWTVQAKMGKPTNLITGLTRDWIMRRLEEGYPESLFDTLLSDALVAALETAKFADAYRLAHLKSRMVDGSRFQMQDDDLARLISFTLTLAAEESVIREAVASRHETDILNVAALGLALHSRGDQVLAETCGEEVLHRFKGLSQFSHRYNSRAGSDEFTFLASAFAQLGVIGTTPEKLAWLVDRNGPAAWLPRVQMLVDEGNLDDLMAVAASLSNSHKKRIISDACIRAAANAGVYITEREDFNALVRTPFVAAIEAVLTKTSTPLNEPIPLNWLKGDYYEQKENLAVLVHQWFFGAVHLSLCMAVENQAAFEFIQAPVYEGRENITDLLNALSIIGEQIAHSWWHGKFVDFHQFYELLEPIEYQRFRQSHNKTSAAEDFRAALHRIACDIHLGSVLLKNIDDVTIPPETMKAALQCTWFDSASFRAQYAAGSLARMTNEAAMTFISAQRSLFDADVQSETSVHLQTPLQLCAIAIAHHLTSAARELCTQTWELTTGYGHRKDPTLSNTVDAIAYLADVAAEDASRLLGQISPQIHHVLNYTDGKGTRHVLAEADRLLAKLKPSALVIKYEEHTYAGDWSLAESSLKAYVKQGIAEGWPLDALMRTGLHPEIRDTLQQLAQDGIANAAERLCILDEHNGWGVGLFQRQDPSGDSTNSKPYEGNVTIFEPEQLDDLLESLESHYEERSKLLRTWYQYWMSQKQDKRLLTELDRVLFSENRWMRDALPLCELAFQTKRRMSGLQAAWKYLVHAQIRKGGWIGYMESEAKIRSRLALVAENYPQRCDEFVTETTYGMFDDPAPSRLAPSELMVYFYIKQNRIEEAVNFAETMVNCVIEDTRTLPLDPPRWMVELVSHIPLEAQ
ncbi:ATP-binding protein [Serratia marcescens]|nr:ATP-binding protein [Serratia marcescens]